MIGPRFNQPVCRQLPSIAHKWWKQRKCIRIFLVLLNVPCISPTHSTNHLHFHQINFPCHVNNTRKSLTPLRCSRGFWLQHLSTNHIMLILISFPPFIDCAHIPSKPSVQTAASMKRMLVMLHVSSKRKFKNKSINKKSNKNGFLGVLFNYLYSWIENINDLCSHMHAIHCS